MYGLSGTWDLVGWFLWVLFYLSVCGDFSFCLLLGCLVVGFALVLLVGV